MKLKSSNLKKKQKLLRYSFSSVFMVTTEDIPHSSGVSEEPVKITVKTEINNVIWIGLVIGVIASIIINLILKHFTF